MSFVDTAYLQKKDLKNGVLNYRRQKTGQLLYVRWEPCMQEIIVRYVPESPLSMYVARHSWASIAKAEGISLSVISESMGHDSESTTQIYLASLDSSVIDKVNQKIIKLV